jgi:polyhydroxyalkanoate synthesis regulator phasin
MSRRIVLWSVVALIGLTAVYSLKAGDEREQADRVPQRDKQHRAQQERQEGMRRMIGKLHELGRHEDAERMEARMHELAEGAEIDLHRLEQRINAMRKKVHALREHDKHDEAERVEHQVEELTQLLKQRTRHEAPRGEGDELGRRIGHLEQAAENLKAAGMHEQVEQLEHVMNELRRQRQHEHAEAEQRERANPRRHFEELRHTVRELREEVQDLRELVQELRERVEDLSADR